MKEALNNAIEIIWDKKCYNIEKVNFNKNNMNMDKIKQRIKG